MCLTLANNKVQHKNSDLLIGNGDYTCVRIRERTYGNYIIQRTNKHTLKDIIRTLTTCSKHTHAHTHTANSSLQLTFRGWWRSLLHCFLRCFLLDGVSIRSYKERTCTTHMCVYIHIYMHTHTVNYKYLYNKIKFTGPSTTTFGSIYKINRNCNSNHAFYCAQKKSCDGALMLSQLANSLTH